MDILVAASSGAIAGLISGVIGSLIAPWVQWAVEKRRNLFTYRRELIKSWRDEIDSHDDIRTFTDTAAYSSLKPHLPAQLQESVEDPTPMIYANGQRGGGSPTKHRLLDEVARIEKEWGLV